MKRDLLYNNKLMPCASGDTIDRMGFLSAILGIQATGDVTINIKHAAEEGGAFEDVPDPLILLGDPLLIDAEAGDLVNAQVDLIGCMQYVQFDVSGGTPFAITLGDAALMPV